MKLEFEIVSIDWSDSAIKIQDVFKKETTTAELRNFKDKTDCLYQVYGDSIIYGRDKLLYIGLTSNLSRRTNSHLETDFSRITNFSLLLGEIRWNTLSNEKFKEAGNRGESLKILESILITYAKPSYNSDNIKDIYPKSRNYNILIQNHGNRRDLPLECSNSWWKE